MRAQKHIQQLWVVTDTQTIPRHVHIWWHPLYTALLNSKLVHTTFKLTWQTSIRIYTIGSPCWGGCQHGLWFHWPSLSAHAQCRWRTSFCRPAPLCQSAGLCSVHGQPNLQTAQVKHMNHMLFVPLAPNWQESKIPELRHLCGWAWTSHCTSGGAPWTEGKTWSSSWCVRGHWSASCGSCGGRMLQMDSASWCCRQRWHWLFTCLC